MKKKWKVVGEFVGHLLMGAVMFLSVLLVEGSLAKVVHWAAPIINDESFNNAMALLEKFLLYSGILFLAWWVVYSTYKAIKDMIKGDDE